MVQKIEKYVAADGTEFDNRADAIAHEFNARSEAQKRYEQFFSTYGGQKLLEQYDITQYGVWQVFGEDDNADFGGHHYQPPLGFFEGTLEQVIRKATSIPRFYSWGAGGRIEFVNPPEVLKL